MINDIEYNRTLDDFIDPRKRLVLHLVFERAWNDSRIDKLTQSLHKFGFQNIVIAVWVSGIKRLEITKNAITFLYSLVTKMIWLFDCITSLQLLNKYGNLYTSPLSDQFAEITLLIPSQSDLSAIYIVLILSITYAIC